MNHIMYKVELIDLEKGFWIPTKLPVIPRVGERLFYKKNGKDEVGTVVAINYMLSITNELEDINIILKPEAPEELSEKDVLNIVKEWYMTCPDIFQNEDGEDLEEYLEQQISNDLE